MSHVLSVVVSNNGSPPSHPLCYVAFEPRVSRLEEHRNALRGVAQGNSLAREKEAQNRDRQPFYRNRLLELSLKTKFSFEEESSKKCPALDINEPPYASGFELPVIPPSGLHAARCGDCESLERNWGLKAAEPEQALA